MLYKVLWFARFAEMWLLRGCGAGSICGDFTGTAIHLQNTKQDASVRRCADVAARREIKNPHTHSA